MVSFFQLRLIIFLYLSRFVNERLRKRHSALIMPTSLGVRRLQGYFFFSPDSLYVGWFGCAAVWPHFLTFWVLNTFSYTRGGTPSVRVSRDVPPFRPLFNLRYTLWLGIQMSNILLLGIIFFFVLSHSFWVIFVKLSFLRKFDTTTVGVKTPPYPFQGEVLPRLL